MISEACVQNNLLEATAVSWLGVVIFLEEAVLDPLPYRLHPALIKQLESIPEKDECCLGVGAVDHQVELRDAATAGGVLVEAPYTVEAAQLHLVKVHTGGVGQHQHCQQEVVVVGGDSCLSTLIKELLRFFLLLAVLFIALRLNGDVVRLMGCLRPTFVVVPFPEDIQLHFKLLDEDVLVITGLGCTATLFEALNHSVILVPQQTPVE